MILNKINLKDSKVYLNLQKFKVLMMQFNVIGKQLKMEK